MISKDILIEIYTNFAENLPLQIVHRNQSVPINSGKIITVTGVRRGGKTSVMMDTINQLLLANVAKDNILFLNFDDDRLPFEPNGFDTIIQAFRELYPDTKPEETYIFFDEVQVANGWEQFVRRLYDTFTKNIFLSGSNSKMLATDIATTLRGRTLQFEVFPLSFSEYCFFTKTNTAIHSLKEIPKLTLAYKEYVNHSAFPELVLGGYRFMEQTLQEYYFVMLYKDLVERYDIKNTSALKYFVKRILANLTKSTSINKINNEMKTGGIKSDKNFLYQVADYLEAIYFFQKLPRWNPSLNKETFSDKKYYCIDNGFLKALLTRTSSDDGILLENLVFLHLRRQFPFGRGLYFYSGSKECDFILTQMDVATQLVQVCFSTDNPDTLARELNGLLEAALYFNCSNLLLVTHDEEREIKMNGFTINVVKAWKWMVSLPI
ncbi:MAG: ATP-binding protein [Bacteroidota bacterium]